MLVHRLAQLHRSLGQRVGLGLDSGCIVAAESFFQISNGVLDRPAFWIANFRAVLGERLLSGMHQRLGMILGFDRSLALLVLFGVRFGILDHLFDVGLGQAARGLDADLLLLAGRLVLCLDVDDAVGVDVERDLDLRHAARRRRNADQVELAEQSCCRPPSHARPGIRGW